ncbi:MAG: hypothetical protein KY053_01110 [Candidatus Liptonbacteria bacterium]|nr:hypothetical protein [Candidatus Liptonbacteria bacterium]
MSSDEKKIHWTSHAKAKMRFYALSESRIKRIINYPDRIEEGIAFDTIALMKDISGTKKSQEIWTMIQKKNKKIIVISAWRYPGKTKPDNPLPRKILIEISEALLIKNNV